MKKQNSVFDKFQEFWGGLNYDEQRDLWDVMTALRGPDEEGESLIQVKLLSTARIRSLLVGKRLGGRGTKGFVFDSTAKAKEYCNAAYRKDALTPKGIKRILDNSYHFKNHLEMALESLKCKYPRAVNAIARSIGMRI